MILYHRFCNFDHHTCNTVPSNLYSYSCRVQEEFIQFSLANLVHKSKVTNFQTAEGEPEFGEPALLAENHQQNVILENVGSSGENVWVKIQVANEVGETESEPQNVTLLTQGRSKNSNRMPVRYQKWTVLAFSFFPSCNNSPYIFFSLFSSLFSTVASLTLL